MSLKHDAVREAVGRWRRKGLIDEPQAEALRAEAEGVAREGERGRSQFALALTGAAVLLVWAGVFLNWTWPSMGDGARSLTLMAVGAVGFAVGFRFHGMARLRPVGQLLQTVSLALLLIAFAYSESAWADRTAGGVVVGILSLIVPVAAHPLAIRQGDLMPAVNLSLGLGFLAVFLDRAVGLEPSVVVWTMDATLVVLLGLLAHRVRGRDRASADWSLHVFVAGLYAGLVLILFTGIGPLEAGNDIVWALDVWLLGIAVLAAWGLRRSALDVSADWYHLHLAACMVAAVPLTLWTMEETLDAPPFLTALVLGAIGVAGLVFSLKSGAGSVLIASCVAILAAAWFWGVTTTGTLGVVLALGLSAVLLFWASARMGRTGAAAASPPEGAGV